jgi:hypothetical protein
VRLTRLKLDAGKLRWRFAGSAPPLPRIETKSVCSGYAHFKRA